MSFTSTIPARQPVVPRPVIESLQSWKFEGLTPQRDQARMLCMNVQTMHNVYDTLHRQSFEGGKEKPYALYAQAFKDELDSRLPADTDSKALVITPDGISNALASAEHTTLSAHAAEDKNFMARMLAETTGPVPLGTLCAYPEKLELIADLLKKNPKQPVAFACGYPHSSFDPAESAQQIEAVQKFMRKHKLINPVQINTVAHYSAWMDGDQELVQSIFAAEARACAKAGFTLKTAMKSLVHASAARNTGYGEDYFKSVYEMAQCALQAAQDEGLADHYIQTGTGLPANAPYNNSVPADATYAESAAPIFMAVADFNRANGTKAGVKIGGGALNEKDMAGLSYLHNHTVGATDNAAPLIVETDIYSRRQLLGFLYSMEQMGGPSCGFDSGALTSSAPAQPHTTKVPPIPRP